MRVGPPHLEEPPQSRCEGSALSPCVRVDAWSMRVGPPHLEEPPQSPDKSGEPDARAVRGQCTFCRSGRQSRRSATRFFSSSTTHFFSSSAHFSCFLPQEKSPSPAHDKCDPAPFLSREGRSRASLVVRNLLRGEALLLVRPCSFEREKGGGGVSLLSLLSSERTCFVLLESGGHEREKGGREGGRELAGGVTSRRAHLFFYFHHKNGVSPLAQLFIFISYQIYGV
jgi:hypothetical protein